MILFQSIENLSGRHCVKIKKKLKEIECSLKNIKKYLTELKKCNR